MSITLNDWCFEFVNGEQTQEELLEIRNTMQMIPKSEWDIFEFAEVFTKPPALIAMIFYLELIGEDVREEELTNELLM